MPAGPDGARSVYGGKVLRFESDGSVPLDSRAGSPVFAYGYEQPAALSWSRERNEIWLAGSSASWSGPLARLPLDAKGAEWPRMPGDANLDSDSSIVSLYSGKRSERVAPAAVGENLVVVNDD